jgi:hypothetical protein
MVGCTHDLSFIIEILCDGLAAMNTGHKRRSIEMQGRPVYVAEERVTLDILGIVWKHNLAGAAGAMHVS